MKKKKNKEELNVISSQQFEINKEEKNNDQN